MQIIMTHKRGLRFFPPVLIIRIMKLTAAFLLTISLNVYASGFSQNVTLTVRNSSLEKVFKEVRKQTGYVFFYKTNLLRSAPKISINVHNAGIKDIMDLCLTGLPLTYSIIERTVVISPKKEPINQSPTVDIVTDIPITGVVSSNTGEPLSGASIRLKGTDIGATTDAKGSFSLSIPDKGGVLVISYIGYESYEVSVNKSSQLKISLKLLNSTADEIVVIGYGSARKTNLTGAVSSVTSKDIASLPLTGFDQALQGRASGVQVTQNSGTPGGSVSIRIRGVGSLTSSTEPLYVVDGVPMVQANGTLNSINPNDIERIDVLKDAASASIYGSRATNGVVLVTTKRGKTGKLSLNFDTYAGTQQSVKKIDLLNGPQFAKLANENLVNGGQTANPEWSNAASLPSTDWQDAIFRNAPIQNYNVSVSSGGEKSRTFISASYFNQKGIQIASDYSRYTVRSNTDFDVSKKLKFGLTMNFSHDNQNQGDVKGTLRNAIRLMPVNGVYAAQEGQITPSLFGWKGYNLIGGNSVSAVYYPLSLNNQVATDEAYVKRPYTRDQMMMSGYGEYEIINGLKFRSTVNYTKYSSLYIFDRPAVPNEINGKGTFVNPSAYTETWDTYNQYNWVNTLSYGRKIGKHNVLIVAGTDALKNDIRQSYTSGRDNPAGQSNLNALATSKNTTGFLETSTLASYLGRVTYDFDNKYLLTASFRRDGSSKFGPKNKYGNFPSGSIGWRISEEPFMKSIKAINELKIRGSYGVVGNQNIPPFRYANAYFSLTPAGGYSYPLGIAQTLQTSYFPNIVGDPTIHWEKSTQYDVGIDATLFNGMFTLSLDYYVKKLDDLLGEVPVPAYLGVFQNKILKNSFSMENKGFEIALGFNKKIGSVNFSANGNFSTLANKVTNLGGAANVFSSIDVIGDGAQTRSVVGQRIGNFWGYVFDGIIQDAAEAASSGMTTGVKPGDRKFKDLNGDGKIDANDKTILGNGLPKYIFGLNLNATYKDFDVSVFLQGQAGVQIANMAKTWTHGGMHLSGQQGLINGSKDLLNSWTGKGSSNEIPRNSYDAPLSNAFLTSAFVENGAFVRMRNVQIGYTMPASLIKKLGLTRLRFYVSGQNLYTFTKYSGWDPEVGSQDRTGAGDGPPSSADANQLQTGVDFARYPVPRVLMVGINVQF